MIVNVGIKRVLLESWIVLNILDTYMGLVDYLCLL